MTFLKTYLGKKLQLYNLLFKVICRHQKVKLLSGLKKITQDFRCFSKNMEPLGAPSKKTFPISNIFSYSEAKTT